VKSSALALVLCTSVVACAGTQPAVSPSSEGSPPHADVPEHPEAALSYLAPATGPGQAQSPINIVSSRASATEHAIGFHYHASKEHLENTGHTLKVNYDSGSSLDFDGKTYDLLQFHFHTPAEHLLDGVTYPMEVHLVHAEREHPDQLLVVGILFKEGAAEPLLAHLLEDAPHAAGEKVDPTGAELDIGALLTAPGGYFHYDGSLTTPPYSETVTWLVLDHAHDASAEQIEGLYAIEGNNSRHIQDQHARLVDHAR
jgi:carbonic anhydrase